MEDKAKRIVKRQFRMFYVLVFVLLALGAYSVYNTNNKSYQNCVTVLKLQNYAIATIDRSSKTLPTLAYYKNPIHKGELRRALKFNEEYKAGFPHLTCTNNILGD